MTVLPRPRRPIDPDRHWTPRVYPANPYAVGWLRADLRADLASVSGVRREPTAAVVLCASEMFANIVARALNGEGPQEVVCVLSLHHSPEGGRVLRLSMAGQGASGVAARVPCPAPDGGRPGDWRESVRGQGLLLIDHFAARWGTRRAASSGGEGGVVWAEFDLPPAWA
ncbi:ATP-binding protein [Nocardiopsis quinghaiensis]|uniref:ATP-binding protein n=1 Tax=Nocardiopsis quinghaiensis TaxID=464995 RepID=UPI00123BA5A5|nr:ATP-binding protein [Nocardiopsis quinghaiensis]